MINYSRQFHFQAGMLQQETQKKSAKKCSLLLNPHWVY